MRSSSSWHAQRALRPAAGLWAALLLGGCAASVPRPPDPARVSAAIIAASDSTPRSGWTAHGDMQWRIDGQNGRGRVRMLLGDEGRVRVDIESSLAFGLGGGRATLWADPDQVFWQEGRDVPRAVSADEIFAPILGERATGVDLELLLLGLSGLGSRWPPPPWTSAPDGKGLGFQATFPGGSMEEARIEGDPPLMTRLARRTAGGKVLFRARFERYREVAHTRVVGRVEVEAPAEGNTLRVDWEQVARDGVSPADLAWPEESSVQ